MKRVLKNVCVIDGKVFVDYTDEDGFPYTEEMDLIYTLELYKHLADIL